MAAMTKQYAVGVCDKKPVEPTTFVIDEAMAVYDHEEKKIFLAKSTGTAEYWKLSKPEQK